MQKLSAIFNDVFSRDRVEGAVMAAAGAAVFAAGNLPLIAAVAVIGGIMGKERLMDTFNAAVNGRQMAMQLVPAVVKGMGPR